MGIASTEAGASCAGHWIESHLGSEFNGTWVHLDMSTPSKMNKIHGNGSMGTGYGVALVSELFSGEEYHTEWYDDSVESEVSLPEVKECTPSPTILIENIVEEKVEEKAPTPPATPTISPDIVVEPVVAC